MKGLGALLFAVVFSMNAWGQKDTIVIRHAKELIGSKKYESAFKLLEEADPDNGKPEIVLLKEQIALNYFVSSVMHEMFAFRDLEPGEDISKYRGKEGSFDTHLFAINDILDSLIKAYPDDYALYKGLGDFYYEVSEKYQGSWIQDDSVLADLIEKNYQVAIDHQIADYMVYYKDGFEFLLWKQFKKAIPLFLRSIAMKSDFADAQYNLAYAYLYTDDRQNALKYAKISFDLYKAARSKSDAARMIGEIYGELKDDKRSTEYYEKAYSLDTGNYYNIKPLLNMYVRSGNRERDKFLHLFYDLAPENPTIYNDLAEIYATNDKVSELVNFFQSMINAHSGQDKVLANLYFNLGRLYLAIDKKKSKEYFLSSKEYFAKFYEADNDIFQTINAGIKEAESK